MGERIELNSDLARQRLGRWLAARLGCEAVTVGEFTKPKSGFSAETAIVEVDADGETRKLVVRREVPDPAVYPQQVPGLDVEIDIQYRAMTELHRRETVPLAPLVGYEADPDLLDAPFFVMGYVAGEVPTESPPYPSQGFFADAAPEQRRAMIDRGLAQMAAIHSLDPADGFAWLSPRGEAPGTSQQLGLWRRYSDVERRDRDFPLLEEAFDWLAAHLPETETVGLCWGDARPGNIIWKDFTPVCLTDFEAVSLGSPMQDLGWWLMFERTMHTDASFRPVADRLPGEPTAAEQVTMYETHRRSAARDIDFHVVFAAARYSAIVMRVMNRLVDRGDLPADNTIWLQNPASAALAQIMEEVR